MTTLLIFKIMMVLLKILNAFLTPIIAILAVYIAYQQKAINKKNAEDQYNLNFKKLNLDLYQLRYRIFNETKQLLLKINQSAEISHNELIDYNFSINESKFLFENDIVDYLEELQNKAKRLTQIKRSLSDIKLYPLDSDERNSEIIIFGDLIRDFTSKYQNIEEIFMRYLDFRKMEK